MILLRKCVRLCWAKLLPITASIGCASAAMASTGSQYDDGTGPFGVVTSPVNSAGVDANNARVALVAATTLAKMVSAGEAAERLSGAKGARLQSVSGFAESSYEVRGLVRQAAQALRQLALDVYMNNYVTRSGVLRSGSTLSMSLRQYADRLEQSLKPAPPPSHPSHSSNPQITQEVDALDSVNREFQALQLDFPERGLAELTAGLLFQGHSTYNFETFSIGASEISDSSNPDFRMAPYLNGGILAGLNTQTASTLSLGVGLVFGDPTFWVANVEVGTYLTPEVFNASASLSVHAASILPAHQPPKSNPPDPANGALMNHAHYLFNPYSAGDLWLSVQCRNFEGGSNSITGSAYGPSLIYALPFPIYTDHPNLCPTLSVGKLWSDNSNLNLHEYSFEYRQPFKIGLNADAPIYVKVGYGTQDHFTAALEFSF
jgi:hypothetical protein